MTPDALCLVSLWVLLIDYLLLPAIAIHPSSPSLSFLFFLSFSPSRAEPQTFSWRSGTFEKQDWPWSLPRNSLSAPSLITIYIYISRLPLCHHHAHSLHHRPRPAVPWHPLSLITRTEPAGKSAVRHAWWLAHFALPRHSSRTHRTSGPACCCPRLPEEVIHTQKQQQQHFASHPWLCIHSSNY